mmetsp:Transcript_29047/g.81868  ORF Transcript_29047/g.81868 Transcript_29047/m.81868 type:complete len:314 (+) Transcript_29047:674-1615(+)
MCVNVVGVQLGKAGGSQLLRGVRGGEGGERSEGLVVIVPQRNAVDGLLAGFDGLRALEASQVGEGGVEATALLPRASDPGNDEHWELLQLEVCGNLRLRVNVCVGKLHGPLLAILVLDRQGGDPTGSLAFPLGEQNHLGCVVLVQEEVGLQVLEGCDQLAGGCPRPNALFNKADDGICLPTLLVIGGALLVVAKGLDGWEALDAVLGAQAFLIIAVHSSKACNAVQLLGGLLPLWSELLAVTTPRGIKLHEPIVLGLQHLLKVVLCELLHRVVTVVHARARRQHGCPQDQSKDERMQEPRSERHHDKGHRGGD